MRSVLILGVVAATVGIGLGGRHVEHLAQVSEQRPIVSEAPLTAEQIAIYRTVLEDYVKNSENPLNLADTTYPLDLTNGFGIDGRCLKGIKLELDAKPAAVVHRLDRAVALSAKIKLVNADEQEKRIAANDPQIVMKSAIDDHENVTEKQIEDSVKRSFETGLFSYSEIRFDKEHRNAVVEYGFACGMLCGHGNTLALKKSGDTWKIRKRCGGWIS